MDTSWNNNEHLPPQPEHNIYPEYTPEYPDVTFFQESYVTMREENIFHGEIPPEERTGADERSERKKKRNRWALLQRFLGSALRGGAALFALSALILGAVSQKEPEPESPAAGIKVLAADLHKAPFTVPQDYTAEEFAALWRGDPTAPHQYDYDHAVILKEASCREPGTNAYVCTECGAQLLFATVKDHEPAAPVTENMVEPDCIHEGSEEEVIFCAVCGEELSRELKPLAALGHTEADPVTENSIAPDCTHEGSEDEVIYCAVCGEELSRSTTVREALGHTEADPVTENSIAPDCTHEGSEDEVIYCAVCGEELSRTTTVREALGHTEADPVTENSIAPDCTHEGSEDEVIYCAVCGEELSRTVKVTAALGHSYTDSITAASCTVQGYTTHTCSRCGDSYRDTYTAALGHSYTDSITAASCTAQGYTTHTCSRCGDSYRDTYTAALGHSFTLGVYHESYTPLTCSRCGTPAMTLSLSGTNFVYTLNSDLAAQLQRGGYEGIFRVEDPGGNLLSERSMWSGGTSGSIAVFADNLTAHTFTCHLVFDYWDDSNEYRTYSPNTTVTYP